ncbi:hypothetical protein OPV22_014239 [Ensete ventricosum]|uniref:Uncharacterized protein n=1 Tax=Ensete ventricosum TaxID=4639 RepID=A0AAV8PJX3_ENSVE|nr:hypothetical protein OPV22_014239 [Ensete ventricosum]
MVHVKEEAVPHRTTLTHVNQPLSRQQTPKKGKGKPPPPHKRPPPPLHLPPLPPSCNGGTVGAGRKEEVLGFKVMLSVQCESRSACMLGLRFFRFRQKLSWAENRFAVCCLSQHFGLA